MKRLVKRFLQSLWLCSEVTTTVSGMTKEDIEKRFKDITDALREEFGTYLHEIKPLSDKIEAVEKKIGITYASQKL